MKATFEIEWPDDHGETWMNVWNLAAVLRAQCPNSDFTVSSDGQEARVVGRCTVGGALAQAYCEPEHERKTLDQNLILAMENALKRNGLLLESALLAGREQLYGRALSVRSEETP